MRVFCARESAIIWAAVDQIFDGGFGQVRECCREDKSRDPGTFFNPVCSCPGDFLFWHLVLSLSLNAFKDELKETG
jgi:hypothetical protein